MNYALNPLLRFWERKITIFALVFLTGFLYFQSLFADPDDPITVGVTPLDRPLSLIQNVLYLFILFLLLARWRETVSAAVRNPVIWLLVGWSILSFFWSDFPDSSLRKGIVTLQTTYFGLYLASRYTFREQLKMLAWALSIVAVLSLLFTLVFPGAAIEVGGNAGSWRGPFAQKNPFARLMTLEGIIMLLLIPETRKYKFILLGMLALVTLLLILANSKTAILVFLILVILMQLYKAVRLRGQILIPILIAIVLIAGSAVLLLLGNLENLLQFLGKDTSLSGRTELWEVSVEKILERPWLGYGYQAFWQQTGEAIDVWKTQIEYLPPHAHNGYLNISLDLGLVGLFLFLSIVFSTYFQSIAWLRLGQTNVSLWPIMYATFTLMYNYSESTIIEHNSIFWTLLVATSLSLQTEIVLDSEMLVAVDEDEVLTMDAATIKAYGNLEEGNN